MTAIAIFVKTPGLSPVKTRLARDWGRTRAETWHRLAAACVAASALQADIGPVYWAVAEEDGMQASLWSGLPRLYQGQGGLGQRMASIYHWLLDHHGSGLLLGADAPQWNPAWLQDAARWLSQPEPRLCLGPARDGGFWTFAGNRPIPLHAWTGVGYSQAETGLSFRRALNDYGGWLELPTLTDLDQLADLPGVISELQALGSRHAAHRLLMDWLMSMQSTS